MVCEQKRLSKPQGRKEQFDQSDNFPGYFFKLGFWAGGESRGDTDYEVLETGHFFVCV